MQVLPKLPISVTPEQFAAVAPQMLRVILSADESSGGFALPISDLTWQVDGGAFIGEIRSGNARFAYRISRQGDGWARDIRVISGVDDGEEFSLPDDAEPDTVDVLTTRLQRETAPIVEGWIEQIRELGQNSVDLQDFAAKIYDLFPDLAGDQLTQVMGEALETASWAGAYEAQEEQGA